MKQAASVHRVSSLKSEIGLAMPMAIIMVLLVSVVGAGLLTFVVSDLEASGQVNRGQQAFGLADAGIAVAEQRIAGGGDPTADGWNLGVDVSLPGYGGSANVKIETNPGGDYVVTSTGKTSTLSATRRVQAVFQTNSSGGGTSAPKNYYSGTDLNMNNNTEMVDGDILVEGQADITNRMELTDGDVLVKGFGNFPNVKNITSGDFLAGGGACFSNATTVNNGNIYIDGTPPSGACGTNSLTGNTTVTGGGIYIGDNATFSNTTKVTGGDVYVEKDARVGNLEVGSGGNVLVGGALTVDNSLKVDNSYVYVGGNASIQNATITNSVIYVGGNTTFSNNNNLTGTSLFAKGDVTISNAITFGNVNDARYGDWKNSFNNVARGSTRTGIGATGKISGNKSVTDLKGSRSYDSTTNPKFVATVSSPQPSNRMTFPFNPSNPQGKTLLDAAASKLTAARDDAIMRIEEARLSNAYYDSLKQKAISQGNYREVASGQQELVETVQPDRPEQQTWPANSDYNTVVYYKFPGYSDGNRVEWLINPGCTNKTRKGILVIENGIFSSYGATSGFNGTVVLRNGKFDVSGSFCMNGYVNAQNGFTSSNSSKFNLDDVPPLSDLNEPSGADLVSWREIYE